VVDHVMLATGYQVDISRYEFSGTKLLKQLRIRDGSPELNTGFESSLPGLHFVGASAAYSFGPLCRSLFTARTLTQWLLTRNGNGSHPKMFLGKHRRRQHGNHYR
jgi:hypothetical protein